MNHKIHILKGGLALTKVACSMNSQHPSKDTPYSMESFERYIKLKGKKWLTEV